MSTLLKSRWPVAVVAAVVACALAACGGPASTAPAATEGRAPAPVAGDPLAPLPLPERTTIHVAVSNKIASYGALLLAGPLGEFEKENLEVEVEVMPAQEALLLMQQGTLDVAGAGMSAGMLNLIAKGADLRAVFPAGGRGPDTKQGIWVNRGILGENGVFDPDDLRGHKIGTLGGRTSIVNATLFDHIRAHGGTITPADVEMQDLNSSDAVVALRSGAVQAANASAPFHELLLTDPCCVFVPDAFPTYPSSQFLFGPSILEQNPQVGAAVVRAMARTVRDRLQGDYLADPQVLRAFAAATDTPEDTLLSLERSAFDPQLTLQTQLVDIAQRYYRDLGDALQYDQPLTVAQVYDTSFVDALGLSGVR